MQQFNASPANLMFIAQHSSVEVQSLIDLIIMIDLCLVSAVTVQSRIPYAAQ